MIRAPSPPVEHAAVLLRAGEIVAFPTETFYGLAVDALSAPALARLVALKGRDAGAAIALIADGLETARRVWRVLPPQLEELARRHWPGALTIVAPARANVPPQLVGPSGGVGVRVSSHPWAHGLAAAFGGLITATSANRSGEPPARTAADVRAQLPGIHVLDGGETPGGLPSTLVEVDDAGQLRVLRAGAVAV